MENRPQGNIGHALLAIGREKITEENIDAIQPKQLGNIKNIRIYDYNSINNQVVFIDDNQACYQVSPLDKPAINYSDPQWHTCNITYFIAPLYPKIHLEAFEAKNYAIRFLTTGPEPLIQNSEVLLRFYLTSSRSYKDSISKNATIQEDLKAIIIEISMPKFIWVAELSSKLLIKSKMQTACLFWKLQKQI